jgi:3-oxoacyl-[acyl-carrier protein] reductase
MPCSAKAFASAMIAALIDATTDAQWDDGLALKLHGARRLTMRAWDSLKASKGAVVFNPRVQNP